MSDAYGVIVTGYSEDCMFDCAGLVAALNKFEWDNENSQWECSPKTGGFLLHAPSTQYPTVFPSEWDESAGYSVHFSLAEICDELTPFITQGWIEICAVANEKLRYAYHETLRLYATGDGERSKHRTSMFEKDTNAFNEKYSKVEQQRK